MSAHQFVPGFPFECLSHAIAIIRDGESLTRKWELIQHLCWFLGCAAAQLDPMDVIGSESLPKPVSDTAKELEALIPAEGTEAVDPATILVIVRLVLELLRQFR